MILKKQFNILELQQLELSVLYNLALWYGVDSTNKGKQIIMYELLEEQERRNKDIKSNDLTDVETHCRASLPCEPDTKKRVYLVAKVSGLPPAEVSFKYEEARKVVESYGYEAVIPTDIVPPNSNWHYAMRLLIPIMLQCDAYTLIDEPWTTAGGLIEDTIANWVLLPKLMFSKL